MSCAVIFVQGFVKQTNQKGFAKGFDRLLHWRVYNPEDATAVRPLGENPYKYRTVVFSSSLTASLLTLSLTVSQLIDISLATMDASAQSSSQAGYWLEIIATAFFRVSSSACCHYFLPESHVQQGLSLGLLCMFTFLNCRDIMAYWSAHLFCTPFVQMVYRLSPILC